MSKSQWTVAGLLLVLAALEAIRSPAVKGFFTNFASQFGVGAIRTPVTPNPTTTIGNATQPVVKGMPGQPGTPAPGGGHPY